MAACSLFEEDEVYVYKPGKGYSFGLVLENSEFLSSGEEDEAEDNERLHKGTIRVSWHPTGKETVVAEDKVHLLDRSLMPGDVVRRLIPGQESQCGFVMDMDVRCHMRALHNSKYIYHVNSKDLTPLQKFEFGQEIMLDSWLGRIEGFDLQVVLLFSDGAKCQTDENDLCTFRDVLEKGSKGEFSVCPFYPGQELKGKLDSLNNAKWLHSTSRFNHKIANKKGKSSIVFVKVEKVIYKSVEIHWLSRGFEKGDNVNDAFSPPPSVIEGEDAERLRVLDWFSHCSVQIGDHMSYMVKNDDVISSVEPAKAYDPKTAVIKDAIMGIRRDSDHKKQEEPVVVNPGVSGTSLEKEGDDGDDADFEDIDDGDKSDPNEKNCCNDGSRGTGSGRAGRKKNKVVKGLGQKHKPVKSSQNQKQGNKKQGLKEQLIKPDDVLQAEIEFTTSWAAVMWQDGTVERDIPSVELFPVHHLDDLEFFPGDFVLSTVDLPEPADYGVVMKADHAERTCLIQWMKAYEVGKATAPIVVCSGCEVSVYDITDHPDYKFRPGQSIVRVGGFEHLSADPDNTLQAVGQIFELDPNGHLVVKWANGTISQCFPQEVFIISEDVDDVSDNNSLESWASESDYETDGSGETWETESENEVIGEDSNDRGCRDDSGFDQGAICEHKQELDALLSRAETALVRLEKLLNVFDISTVSVPECFHDIIRIYRSCHDLDKILQSSFFVDPELQLLISQAKKELRHDKANKLSKHLSHLFEAWSNSLPSEDTENVGTVDFGGKTIRVGAQRKGADIEVSLQVATDERDNCDISVSFINSGAAGSSELTESADSSSHIHEPSAVSDATTDHVGDESKTMKEPSDCARSAKTDRRSSDPSNISAALGTKSKKNKKDANLVGENCVSKAAKRTKSDGCDDFGHEAKKSRDETMAANHVAQELCYKICQNLQKQILKIHEEVNKRTRRLLIVSVKQSGAVNGHVASEDTNVAALAAGNLSDAAECDQNEDSEDIPAALRRGKERGNSPGASRPLSPASPPVNHQEEDPADKDKPALQFSNTSAGGDRLTGDAVNEDCSEILPSESSVSQKEETAITLEDVKAMQVPCKGFDMYGEVQLFHVYVSRDSQPANPRMFRTAVKKELKLFQTSLPDGIFIKGFEDRLDLYSFMILGPTGTPYEDALFLFDMMLPNDYPNDPPLCHYHSYCTDRLNPNLYEDGKLLEECKQQLRRYQQSSHPIIIMDKTGHIEHDPQADHHTRPDVSLNPFQVCVSLLGTWAGKGTEVWTSKSNLLQVLVSIQGLILVPEPYYNEAGYERQRGTQVGQENSRMYNEMAILKAVQSLIKMCHNLPTLFKQEIYHYLRSHGPRMVSRLRYWMRINEQYKKQPSVNGSITSQSVEKSSLPRPAASSVSQPETPAQKAVSTPSNQPTLPNGLPNSHTDHLLERNDATTNNELSPNQIQNATEESGNVKATEESGNVKATEESGNVKATEESGNVKATDESGNVKATDESGNVKATDESGNVKATDEASNRKAPNASLSQESGEVMKSSSAVLTDAAEPQLGQPGDEHLNQFAHLNGSVSKTETPTADKPPSTIHELAVPRFSSTVVPAKESLTADLQGDFPQSVKNASGNTQQGDIDIAAVHGSKESHVYSQPEFPLFPMSRGFCLTLQKFLNIYEQALQNMETPATS